MATGWGSMRKTEFKYTQSTEPRNKVMQYSGTLTSFNKLGTEYEKILRDGCFYFPHKFCKMNDMTIFNKLKSELDSCDIIQWSKHSKYENPKFSSTFNEIVKEMGKYFGVDIIETRLNYYKDGVDWKPLHHDKHAFGEGGLIKENFTMGASFGASRVLDMVHEESNMKFNFPQNNGDVFAFDSVINKLFLHGIPKTTKKIGERFSIIAWGNKN